MLLEDFDYELPKDLIAQSAAEPRDSCKLLRYERRSGLVEDMVFSDVGKLMVAGDVLVINNSKVIPSRILFTWGGKEAEVFFAENTAEREWIVMGRPGKMLVLGSRIAVFGVLIEVVEVLEGSMRRVKVSEGYAELVGWMERHGILPLPPYIKENERLAEQYQNVYAGPKGSVAAPTAGLHFTPRLLKELAEGGVRIVEITLHVGLGTFLGVTSRDIRQHKMHSERYEIGVEAAEELRGARKEGRRIVAVGTTSVRALEDNVRRGGEICAGSFETDIFIYPGFEYLAVGGLITNFHLPKSSLLMLVSAMVGRDKLMELYSHAIKKQYRFYSLGDAMIIL